MGLFLFRQRPVHASPCGLKRKFLPSVGTPTKKPAPATPTQTPPTSPTIISSPSTSAEVTEIFPPALNLQPSPDPQPEKTTKNQPAVIIRSPVNSSVTMNSDQGESESDESEYDEEEEPAVFINDSLIPTDIGDLELRQILALNEADFELIQHLVIPQKQNKSTTPKQLPSVVIGSDGNLVLNEDTLTSSAPRSSIGTENTDKTKKGPCTKKEKNLFYLGVRLFGKNPDKISQIIPGRTRSSVKNWLTTERKRNPALLASVQTLEPEDLHLLDSLDD